MRGVRVPLKHLFFHLLNLGPPGEGRNLSAPMCLNASHPPVETRSQASLPARSLECGCRSPGSWDTHGWLRQQLPGPVELGQEAASKPGKGPRWAASWPCERPPLHLSGTPWMAGGCHAGPGLVQEEELLSPEARRVHSSGCKTSEDGYGVAPPSPARHSWKGRKHWPPSRRGYSFPTATALPSWLWFLRETRLTAPMPPPRRPSLGTCSRLWVACVRYDAIIFICSCISAPLLTRLFIHMLGLATGKIVKEKSLGSRAPTHRLSSSCLLSSAFRQHTNS